MASSCWRREMRQYAYESFEQVKKHWKWKWLIAVFLFLPFSAIAEQVEPWGIKQWLIGATLDEVGLSEQDYVCESDDLNRNYCAGRDSENYPETVAQYPAKVRANFWNDEAVGF